MRRRRSRLEIVELLAKIVDAIAQISYLTIDFGSPAVEVGLGGSELRHRVVDVVKATIGLENSLRLLVQLGENERQLIFNLHHNLQAGAMFVSQFFDPDSTADPTDLGSDL